MGKTTVMHLVLRERLPEPTNQGKAYNKYGWVETKKRLLQEVTNAKLYCFWDSTDQPNMDISCRTTLQ